MPKLCINCNKYPVFSHKYCKYCQYLRTDKKKPHKIISKKKPIKHTSNKRSDETELYNHAKIEVREELILKGEWTCFFNGKDLPLDFWEFHHLLGKEGELLYTKSNIRPAIRSYHTQYHHLDIQRLLDTDWYVPFIFKISDKYPEVFQIEARRIMKANIDTKVLFKYFGDLTDIIKQY